MRVTETEKYYRENSAELGWGPEIAKLDSERLRMLDRHVAGPKILDVACGSGIYTDYLAKRGFDAWGIDLVADFIEKAKTTKQGTYLQGEADRLPFADGEFDTVLLFDILEHVDDAVLLREAKRVASKRILVNVPRKADKALEQRGIVFGHYVDKSHLREYTEESLRLLALDSGVDIVCLQGINPLKPLEIFRGTFSGNPVLKKLIKCFITVSMKSGFYPQGIFAVLEKRK